MGFHIWLMVVNLAIFNYFFFFVEITKSGTNDDTKGRKAVYNMSIFLL